MNAAKAKNGSKGRKQIKPAPGVVGKLAGSVKGLQEQALKALESAPSLKAAKDGRRLAVRMLRDLKALYGKARDGEFMAVPVLPAESDEDDGPTVCRTGKQSTLISDAIAAAFEAAPEVRAGFMQILTDYIGTGALIGERNLNAYDQWEKAGLFDAAPRADRLRAEYRAIVDGAASEDEAAEELAMRRMPILETEKDGRLYAISLLESMEEECEEGNARNESPFSAEADESDATDSTLKLIYRKGPQSDTLKRWMGELYQYGTPAAIGGFYVILTDYLGTVLEGSVPNAEFYVEREQAGGFQPWGSVIYTRPELAKAAIKAGESAYSIGGKSEPKQPERKATKRTAKAQELAEALSTEYATAMYALLDFGKNYADNAINGMTARASVGALAGKILNAIAKFDSQAHSTNASKEVKRALVALYDLELLMSDASNDDAGGEPMELSKRGQARCMFAFAMDAAQAIERAQIAIGAKPNEGFLQSSYNPSEYN